MVRFYGFYSNVSRGKRKKQDQDGMIPSILDPDGTSKEYRRNWARLIQKIYETDPLCCPKCQGRMRILAFIEDEEATRLPCLKSVRVGWKRKLEKERSHLQKMRTAMAGRSRKSSNTWDFGIRKPDRHSRRPTRRHPSPIRITRILRSLFLTITSIATRITPLKLMNRVNPRS